MENKEIIKRLGLIASLLELHGENPFKVRGYSSAVYHLDKADVQVAGKSREELEKLEGVGKGIAATIAEMNETGESATLDKLLAQTPEGLVSLLEINGFGPKKIRTLWQELDITDGKTLYEACKAGKIAAVKGFGAKLQEKLENALQFTFVSQGKFRYRQVEEVIGSLVEQLKSNLPDSLVEAAGEFRRNMEVVNNACIVIGIDDPATAHKFLDNLPSITKNEQASGPFTWRGKFNDLGLTLEIHITDQKKFFNLLLKHTGSAKHLSIPLPENGTLYQIISEQTFGSEADAYSAAGLQFIEPEMREGSFEFQLAQEQKLPELLKLEDLKGTIHNHSTYSDGKNSLREMAEYCKGMGYEYLGIADHSKTAIYANGLDEDRINQQHQEIDELNKELAPFKIFKGIESDILNEGDLDYDDDVLASFDFIVASIHSQLSMDINKATNRLLTAIANPFTTMLGHPTGRLLLKREGYPINHKAVIDACAENNVIIEINAHPFRLDLDWRWVHYALEKGVMLSINPDAHSTAQYELMKYGVLVGRKGGLTKKETFNCLDCEAVDKYFRERKEKVLSKAQ
ncbi:DNA polymerase/3'-5' exonuclease PolX [Fulvivirgaceae bacterium BMA12]|uniref:DNA polymerase/3'-5' exonuclease PolX n=1 Tax=Agaribacillus aureus TaxID=3051825 RepID=A0ABT8LF83_9BACT|nr:DNA polymerase/3'-5' exonuclease PolX [Fulvivirgaceae bacterium BMA12]